MRPDRARITLEMCESAISNPLEGQVQDNGRTSHWTYVDEESRYLKVVVEADGEEITTAHWDRGFRRKVECQRREGR